jgi:hypothetical protein
MMGTPRFVQMQKNRGDQRSEIVLRAEKNSIFQEKTTKKIVTTGLKEVDSRFGL